MGAVREGILWFRTSPCTAEGTLRIGIQVTVATKRPRSEVWFMADPSSRKFIWMPNGMSGRPVQLKLAGGQMERKAALRSR